MVTLVKSLKLYLRDVLNAHIEVHSWKSKSLPFYLVDHYFFYDISIFDTPCLLMMPKDNRDITPGTIRKHQDQIQKLWKGPIVYVPSTLLSYNRKRLIEQHIPFIVPGNQMYLPHLGMDLREHFKKMHTKQRKAFSPVTQAVIIFALLCKTHEKLTPSILTKKLGYTLMTMTRALQELQTAKIGEVHKKGRERYWTFPDKRELWEQAKEFLRSPVKKRIWLNTDKFKTLAGLSALSHFSQLAPPSIPVFAIGAKEWKLAGAQALPSSDEASLELEIWNYNPELFAKKGVVDPFSLYLSLESDGDERIESALEHMMENFYDNWP